MGNKQQITEKRYQLIDAVLDTLQSPDDVWQHYLKDVRQASKEPNTLYIKYYQDKVIVVATKVENNDHHVPTFYSTTPTDELMANKRVGILLKKQ